MICIILVAGHGAQLEKEIKNSKEPHHKDLIGIPKALLTALSGKKIIDYWWNVVNMRQLFSEVYLVTNADKYKHFERWATANGFPVENIVNDGSTTVETSLGSVADFGLVLQNKQIKDDVLVVAGDMLFEDKNCDIAQVVRYFKHKEGELVIYYELDKTEDQGTRGIVEVDPGTNRVNKFFEKPVEGQTDSLLASVVFYCFRQDSLAMVNTYLTQNLQTNLRSFGKYMEWLINETHTVVYGMKLPTRFQLIGQVTLDDYEKCVSYFKLKQTQQFMQKPLTCKAFARVGLMGNPSDGFGGKTISMSISNFWASATIHESKELVLVPHPLNDPNKFGSLGDLYGISQKEGYLGGIRLLQATCKKFYQYCSDKGIALCKKNFTLSYDTNIPRQVGLAGSSAIVTATLQCLIDFFNLSETDMPRPIKAQVALSVETDELYINAGLQDRVVQVYEGLVYMDFSKNLMDAQGYGNYEYLACDNLPEFWLAYNADPSDSGKVHSDVRQRFEAGDDTIKCAMNKFADLALEARKSVTEGDWETFALLMDQNFDLRLSIYGSDCIGEKNLEMIEIARKHSSSAKFPGSGGAVVGICNDAAKKVSMKKKLQSKGYVYCDLVPVVPK